MEEKRVTRELDAEMSKQAWIRVKDKPKYNARWYRVHRPCPNGQGRFFISAPALRWLSENRSGTAPKRPLMLLASGGFLVRS